MLYFFVVVIVVSFVVYGAKVCTKKVKKNLFAIVFLISFAIRVRWVPVVLLVFRLWCLWWSLRSCVRWWSLWSLRSGSGCILCYFANLGKMGSTYAHTRIYAYTRIHAQ